MMYYTLSKRKRKEGKRRRYTEIDNNKLVNSMVDEIRNYKVKAK